MRQPRSALPRSRIRRLRLRQPPSALPLHERWAMASELARADLDSSGTAEAMVLIRHVAIQHRAGPGRGGRPGVLLRERVAELARQAARPVGARLPTGAVAVLLADWAEALAVLAVSACEHRLADEWWWGLLWEEAGAGNWLERWLEQPGAVPSAWHILQREGHAPLVLASLDAAAGEQLLGSLVHNYDLPHVQAAWRRWRAWRHDAQVTEPGEKTGQRSDVELRMPAMIAHERERAWPGAVEMSAGGTERWPVHAWASVAAGLLSGSEWVRRAEFAEALLGEWRDPQSSGAQGDEVEGLQTPTTHAPLRSEETLPTWGARTIRADVDRVPSTAALSQASVEAEREPKLGTRTETAEAGRAASQDAAASVSMDTSAREQGENPFAAGSARVEAPVSEARWETVFTTETGGVFYLANVALQLGLYGDFTQPQRPGLALPFWDFLAGVGMRWWLADQRERFRADPLWTWLARMSGRRPEEDPGTTTVGPDELGEAWHVWLGMNEGELPVCSGEPWRTWAEALDEMAQGMRQRLERALGTEAGLLLMEPARIQHRPGSVRAHFDLARHPLSVRLAGLDRDPGWIPRAGVDLRFIYD